MKRFLVSMFAMLGIVACSKDNLEPVEPPEPEPVTPGSYVPYVDPSPVEVSSDVELSSDFYSAMNAGLESYFDDFVCNADANGLPSFSELAKMSQENLQKYFGTYFEFTTKGYLKEAGIIGDMVSGWLFGTSATNPMFALLGQMSSQLSTIIGKLDELIEVSQKTYDTLKDIEANVIYKDYKELDRRVKTLGDLNATYYARLMDIQDTDTLARKKKQTEIITEWAWIYVDGKPTYLNAMDIMRAVCDFNKRWNGQMLNHLAIFDKFTRGAACWENCTWAFRDAYRMRLMYEGMRSAYLLFAYYDILYTSKNPATMEPVRNVKGVTDAYINLVKYSEYVHSDNTICLLPGQRFEFSPSGEDDNSTFFYAYDYSSDKDYVCWDDRDLYASVGRSRLTLLHPFRNFENGRHAIMYYELLDIPCRFVGQDHYYEYQEEKVGSWVRNNIMPASTVQAIVNYYKGQHLEKPVSLHKMFKDGRITFRNNSGWDATLVTDKTYFRAWSHRSDLVFKDIKSSFEICNAYFIGNEERSVPKMAGQLDKDGWPQLSNGYFTDDNQAWDSNGEYVKTPGGSYTEVFTPSKFTLGDYHMGGPSRWQKVLLLNKNKLVKGFEAYGTKY